MKAANTTLRNQPTPLGFGWGMTANVVDGGTSASLFETQTQTFRLWVGGCWKGMMPMDLGR